MEHIFERYATLVELFLMKGLVLDRAFDDQQQMIEQPLHAVNYNENERLILRLVDDRKKLLSQIEKEKQDIIAKVIRLSEMVVIEPEELLIYDKK